MACIENCLDHGLHHESFNDRVWRMDNHKDGDGYRAEAHAEASKPIAAE